MKVYADTNVFTNFWLKLSHTDEASALVSEIKRSRQALPITRLLRMEMTNALQRLVFESRTGTQSFRVTMESAAAIHSFFLDELALRETLKWTSIDEAMLEAVFDSLSHRHTAKHGFRTYDILHVASALILGCDTFWSFDERAKRLAALEGLRTNG